MKKSTMYVIALLLAIFANAGNQVHQKVQAENPTNEKNKMEIKEVKGAEEGKVARVKGSMNQWGFVSYWLGIPTPDGKSTIRLRVFHDGNSPAIFAVYINLEGQKFIKKIEIPEDAENNTFVNIDIPVETDAEWSGIFLKKFEKSDKPSPWIDSITVLLPEE
ncbi:MAG TPA: hypothetical protein P5105_03590 [Victivallales bacterium]|nr:hypothetical protein [Victivallales bacterium]HRR06344.1 hypothetical protein [Victivallales bacterium]